MKALTDYPIADLSGLTIKPGDIMRFNRYGNHLRNLRDGYLGAGGPDRSTRKGWYDAALAERFEVTEVGHNGFCPVIRYKKVGSDVTGECMASNLELASV